MRIIFIIAILTLLLLAACAQDEPVEEEPGAMVISQQVLSDPVDDEPVMVTRTLRIIDSKLDPEEIRVPAGSTLDLTIESDVEMVLSFPEFDTDEKIINSSPMVFLFDIGEPGSYEFHCVNGCTVPLTGTIVAE